MTVSVNVLEPQGLERAALQQAFDRKNRMAARS